MTIGKTVPELTAETPPIVGTDEVVVYRSPGPLKRATAATVRTYMQSNLGTMATQNANAVAITGGSITGITDLAVTDGGTGASDASGARTNLGLVIGADVVGFNGALGTPSSGTLTNATGLPIAGLVSSTSTALGVGSLELGNATDTTLARSSAGNMTIEGNLVYRAGGTDVPITDGGTGSSTAADARTALAVVGTADLAASTGATLVGSIGAGTGAYIRTVQAKLRDLVSVKDFGAIGDGTSHEVSEWIPSRFANLAAVQAEYPDVTATTDQIDFAAINAAIRYAVANTKGVFIPAGLYLAYVKAWYSNVCIVGAGSSCTTIKVPNGATHTIPENVNPGPPNVTGVPCVVDFNCIGHGNAAVAMSNGHISGLTLNGNAANTTVPSYDLFGWGLSFTAYSEVTYHDIVVVDAHTGGVGTFINSNYHIGSARVKNCGNSLVDGVYRPGFDVNSSKYSHWEVITNDCAYGARLVDNCYNNFIDVVVYDATIDGFVYNNQTSNSSYCNTIRATVNSGCSNWAFSLGANCFNSDIELSAAGVGGGGFTTTDFGSGGIYNGTGNRIKVITQLSQRESVLVNTNGNDFDIVTDRDGQDGGQGAYFAVSVFGDNNTFKIRHKDSATWNVRGLSFRSGASGNRVISYIWDTTTDPYQDVDGTNYFTREYKGSKTYDPPSLADNAVDITNVTVTGAAIGMFCSAGFSSAVTGILVTADVANTDTVQVRITNKTGGTYDLSSGTLAALAWTV